MRLSSSYDVLLRKHIWALKVINAHIMVGTFNFMDMLFHFGQPTKLLNTNGFNVIMRVDHIIFSLWKKNEKLKNYLPALLHIIFFHSLSSHAPSCWYYCYYHTLFGSRFAPFVANFLMTLLWPDRVYKHHGLSLFPKFYNSCIFGFW